jgi:hypothetical protein
MRRVCLHGLYLLTQRDVPLDDVVAKQTNSQFQEEEFMVVVHVLFQPTAPLSGTPTPSSSSSSSSSSLCPRRRGCP